MDKPPPLDQSTRDRYFHYFRDCIKRGNPSQLEYSDGNIKFSASGRDHPSTDNPKTTKPSHPESPEPKEPRSPASPAAYDDSETECRNIYIIPSSFLNSGQASGGVFAKGVSFPPPSRTDNSAPDQTNKTLSEDDEDASATMSQLRLTFSNRHVPDGSEIRRVIVTDDRHENFFVSVCSQGPPGVIRELSQTIETIVMDAVIEDDLVSAGPTSCPFDEQ